MLIMQKNVFGEALELCCTDPLTGYFRDGKCRTEVEDIGKHLVCAVMTDEFLEFSKQKGNDLSTPKPEYGFEGLKEGDKWCLCAIRWVEAYRNKMAPLLMLEACHEEMLEYVDLKTLINYAYKG
jgi:uncharacterized protein (DUF2237 family)